MSIQTSDCCAEFVERTDEESQAALPEEVVSFIEKSRGEPFSEHLLKSVLQLVQDYYGYLGTEQLDAVATLMQVPAAKVQGVASFYHYYRVVPHGRFVVRVCTCAKCRKNGATAIVDKLKSELGIRFGETTEDGLFALEDALCAGNGSASPLVMVNKREYADVTPDEIPGLIQSYQDRVEDEELPIE